MRMHEVVDIAAKEKPKDFGKGAPEWPAITKGLAAEIKDVGGQMRRTGDKVLPAHDAEITVRWNKAVYTAWQDKRPVRVADRALGDVWNVQSMTRIRRGRLWWLKMRCVRG